MALVQYTNFAPTKEHSEFNVHIVATGKLIHLHLEPTIVDTIVHSSSKNSPPAVAHDSNW